MTYQFSPSAFLIFVAVLMNGLVLHLAWQRRYRRAGKGLALLCAAVMVWQLGVAMSRGALQPELKLLWVKFAYIGITTVPVLFLCFALAYTRRDRWLSPGILASLFAIPVVILFLAWTNERHDLIWSGFQLSETGVFRLAHGPMFWAHTTYSYLLMLLGSILLAIEAFHGRRLHKSRSLIILAGLWVAWGSNIISLFSRWSFIASDVTPVALGVAGVLFLLGIWRMDLFDLAPVARAEVVERMHDGLLIIDERQQLIDCNPAAMAILGFTKATFEGRMLGRTLSSLLGDVPGLAERMNTPGGAPLTVKLPAPGGNRRSESQGTNRSAPRMYDLTVTTLYRHDRRMAGHAVTLHDVTLLHHMAESEARARQMAEALRDIGVAVGSTLQFDQVLHLILDHLRNLFAVDSCNILLLQGGELQIAAVYGLKPDDLIGFRIPYTDEYPNKRIIETRQVVNLSDAQRQYPAFSQPMHRRIRSWMGAPLVVEGQVLGTLNLDSEELNHFQPDDERNIMAFAVQAAIAIKNSRLYTEARKNTLELEALNEIFQTITTKLDLTDLLGVVRTQVRRFFDFDQFLVATYQPGNDAWTARYITGADGQVLDLPGQPTAGLTGFVIRNRRPLLLSSLEEVQAFVKTNAVQVEGALPRSFMGVPLVMADRLVGAMVAEHHQQDQSFRADNLRLFSIIGSQVAIAMENARLFAEVREMAITDGLTGLFTRRHFFDQARKAVLHANRYIEPISAMMIDLDYFKQINDSYGHASGDSVLNETAQVCRKVLRDVDIIGRYGGEEIAVIMPVTTLEQAYQVADRLRLAIASYPYGTLYRNMHVSVSIGVATLAEGNSLESLLEQADQALYVAKQGGRNRVAFS